MPEQSLHQSVLLNEVVEVLGPIHGGYYLDATFGNGGYSRAILDEANCTLVAIDRDPDAIKRGATMKAEYAEPLSPRRRVLFRYGGPCQFPSA